MTGYRKWDNSIRGTDFDARLCQGECSAESSRIAQAPKANAVQASANGLQYTVDVTPNANVQQLPVSLSLVANGVKDGAGNALANQDLSSFDTQLVDTQTPSLNGVTIPGNAAKPIYKAGEALLVNLAFSEAVVVSGSPNITLNVGGQDRIADNNLLTLGATTRLLDPATGAEAARFGVAQRLRFSDQNVTLPGAPAVSERLSDVMLGAAVNWTPQWGMDSTVQFNQKTGRSIRSTIGARYQPGDYRVVSAAYRLQRGTSEQVDVGWQWPLNSLWGDAGTGSKPSGSQGRWYSVGRLNYSLQDRKLVDTVVGFEYDSCCWIGRVVLERLQNSQTTSNTRLLFQIEFVGFSRLSLGSSPLETFKQHVPRYQYLRDQVGTPSRFSNYD